MTILDDSGCHILWPAANRSHFDVDRRQQLPQTIADNSDNLCTIVVVHIYIYTHTYIYI
jgi:hypothetical protein